MGRTNTASSSRRVKDGTETETEAEDANKGFKDGGTLMNKLIAIAITFTLLTFSGRISSYKPGLDGHSGTRLAGARCLNLKKSLWDYKSNYPVPVCAMRAGCGYNSDEGIRFGDHAFIKRKNWHHWCIVLDSGPWGCLDKNSKWHNCAPKSKYKGKLPSGWKWKSIIDVAHPLSGYPGGGKGTVTLMHIKAKKSVRKQIVLQYMNKNINIGGKKK